MALIPEPGRGIVDQLTGRIVPIDLSPLLRAQEEAMNGEFKVTKMSTHIPISEEMAMDLGLIPDTRPAPTPPTWRQRGRTWVRGKVRGVRWWLAAKIGGMSREAVEEESWLW